jgi:hypothetical protein
MTRLGLPIRGGIDISDRAQVPNVDTAERKPYSRREIIVIIVIIILGALILGNFNSTTTTLQSVSSGPLTISSVVTCNGFGEPIYYSTMDPDLNYTTYQYGHCYFGFWFSNGQQFNGSNTDYPSL